jgi:glucosylceramidase
MLPLILAAQRKTNGSLKLFGSPWSPPAWMKVPVAGKQSMISSAKPQGLLSEYEAAWAKYISNFISAYKAKGVPMWGLTVQNEPEFAAPWEACVYNATHQVPISAIHR